MKDLEILKDILDYRIRNQMLYNENLLKVRNPEIRELFAQLRDDETRDIIKLQQKIEKIRVPKSIITKIIPTRPTY
ncbi:MAG: hypothetical protein ACOZCL_13870 [Bacillota bacterium]